MTSRRLDDEQLEQSEVVANCRMNRERNLVGSNSYEADLGFSPLAELRSRCEQEPCVRWLDVCCGTGRALIQAGEQWHAENNNTAGKFIGIDLVDFFDALPDHLRETVQLLPRSITNWRPETQFDLITCVHGLHYLGDKLQLLARVVSWLKPNGKFAAHLDLNSIQIDGHANSNRLLLKWLRDCGFEYNRHRHLLSRIGKGAVEFPVEYLGADDTTGPNYTGQPAVSSYYQFREKP